MSAQTITGVARRVSPRRETLLAGALLVNAELLAVLGYLAVTDTVVTDATYLAIPFVWLNVALWAVERVEVPDAVDRHRYAAAAASAGYFLVLAWFGGLLMANGAGLSGVVVRWGLPPGWGPLVTVGAGPLMAHLFPFKLAGYLALTYLVYVTVLDAVGAGSALGGVVGLFSCVSCAWPVLGTVVAGLLGSGSAVAAVATGAPYQASTVVFVSAVALLAWRPTW